MGAFWSLRKHFRVEKRPRMTGRGAESIKQQGNNATAVTLPWDSLLQLSSV